MGKHFFFAIHIRVLRFPNGAFVASIKLPALAHFEHYRVVRVGLIFYHRELVLKIRTTK